MKSMNSAVAGLRAMQTAMDVIGNNIANVNTNGFKASRTDFGDLFYQTLEGGTEQVNPSEVGYGSKVASVVKDMSNNGAVTTDRALDLYIDGNGYFTVNSTNNPAADPTTNGTKYYTRVGATTIDPQGYLVDENGNYVMGVDTGSVNTAAQTLHNIRIVGDGTAGSGAWFVPTDGTATQGDPAAVPPVAATIVNIDSAEAFKGVSNMTINADGTITAQMNGKSGILCYNTGTTPATTEPTGYDATTQTVTGGESIVVGLASFANEDGLSQVGSNYFTAGISSGAPQYMQAGNNNTTTLKTGALEQSNVDLAKEFTTMITTQRGFQANSRVITVSDSLLDEVVNLKRS